jgi:aspartyl-tRNA(Asn)/glutamyl-tRNA(Gln) amidotransferase subunit A
MMFAALGSDTGGSIRLPAMFCGVSGLMPTFGLVPNAGSVPSVSSLTTIGPLARSARDCGHVLSVLAGPDPRDPDTVAPPVEEFAAHQGAGLRGITIGVVRADHLGLDGEDPAVAPAFDDSLEVLRSLGATLVDVTLPHYREVGTAVNLIAICEQLAYHRPDLPERLADFVASSRVMLPLGLAFSGADYVQAQRVRRVAQRELARLFERVDVIATPPAATAAPSYDTLLSGGWAELLRRIHTVYWNGVGTPVLVVPNGFNAAGLPLSLQLAARPFEEALLVHVGDAYQTATDWHEAVPPALAAPTV